MIGVSYCVVDCICFVGGLNIFSSCSSSVAVQLDLVSGLDINVGLYAVAACDDRFALKDVRSGLGVCGANAVKLCL